MFKAGSGFGSRVAGGVRASAWALALLAVGGVLPTTAAQTVSAAAPWQASRQMVVVVVDGWDADHGELRRYRRSGDGAWQEVGAAAHVTIGKAGAAWGVGLSPAQHDGPVKREGDDRSPAGVFGIGEAFGYAPKVATALPYRALTATDYCVDVSSSPDYNRIVDANVVGAAAVEGATEPMRRDLHFHGDQAYREGFVIEHNPRGVPLAGSCIFAHLAMSPTDTTVGCTAMAAPVMQSLLAWLKPTAHPVFVLLPRAEYARLQAAWALPQLADAESPTAPQGGFIRGQG